MFTHIEPWHWVILGILLIVLEIFIPTFTALWFGLGALLTGAVLYFLPQLNTNIQLILWITSSIVCTVIWFVYLNPKNKSRSIASHSKELIIGQEGLIISFNPTQNIGKIRFIIPILGNSEWDVISNAPLKEGDKAQVSELSGNKLIVTKKELS